MSNGNGLNGHEPGHVPPTGASSRFERRWLLVGAGLSNVWRFGDLELPAASGRLLLRGANGTGKTTALEALVPYLLDLNAARMSAGKARTTNLSSLMREGADGKRRYGYAWITLAERREGTWSFGVRIQYSEGGSPPVKVIPFAVPGRPLHQLQLYGVARAQLAIEQFSDAVAACGGQVFETEEAYVSHLAARLFGTPDRQEVATLAARLRQVRNPALLVDISPQAAADALRESLPGVAEDVIAATADALAESDATRAAFTRDKEAAELLVDFRSVWCAHVTEVVSTSHAEAVEAAKEARAQLAKVRTLTKDLAIAAGEATQSNERVDELERQIEITKSEMEALEKRQEYQDAGKLSELKKSAAAQSSAAESAVRAMQATAREVASECGSIRRELENLREDLSECETQARSADVRGDLGAPLLTWTSRPRSALRAGDAAAEPGPELIIQADTALLRDTASSWTALAKQHAGRAESATLAIVDHQPVEVLEQKAQEKSFSASRAQADADGASAKAKRAEAAAQDAARALLGLIQPWTLRHSLLTQVLVPAPDIEPSKAPSPLWGVEDVEQLGSAEPGQVLAASDSWGRHVMASAASIAGDLRGRAKVEGSEAERLGEEARVLRDEAEALRSGRLLPLPCPEWARPGDDSIALGAALDWRESFDVPRERALLEAVMAAAGLLGATIGKAGASTCFWRVEPTGPVLNESLGDLVAVDASHPWAEAAAAVLARVRVVPTATVHGDEGTLCIGRDGTFSAGVLHGRVPGADDASALAPASHVGAHQRRAAALARAQLLDQEAAGLEAEAKRHRDTAAQLEGEAEAVLANARSFPSRDELRGAESRRIELSGIAREAQEVATTASAEYRRALSQAESGRAEWSERTRSRGLPADVAQLVHVRDHGADAAEKLRKAAGLLSVKLAARLERVIGRYSVEDIEQRLARAAGAAQEAHRTATNTQTAVRVLEETAGASIADVLSRHDKASQHLRNVEADIGPARETQLKKIQGLATAQANLTEAERKAREETQPTAGQRLTALRGLLMLNGVADAVLDGEALADEEQLIDQVARKLQGRKSLTLKTVLERADTARAKLAGIWSLDPGDNHGELLTYVLTYRDATYTPIEAAVHAEKLKVRAEQALAASEERALREFVIGRLPSAIGTAWIRLKDWEIEVNRKMRAAAASSGVGVQVRLPVREDLAPAARDVFELACKISGADRTPDQQRRLGEALQALLTAAQGESMQHRVESAVNIREWVEVRYEVTRPGGTKQRWSSRTGLSSGERRLVVLAPMLAAIAAGYDRFSSTAFRAVMLDEVPAEVDERGREGLARYIAELDLDLVCTSHLWDGCPGAWDGIDAHDLEAGPDGMVVAFPMLVRGVLPIPDVADSNGATVERLE